ncbi:PsiF family protein [Oxalicibacterium flavum]|nr:PsiF family protein [Oxalicibacterium flavum]
MKKIMGIAALLLPLAFHPAHADTSQQNKMTACNKEAGAMKGDERKAFMKSCLSSKPKVSDAQQAQREKMKSCNAAAGDRKGDERKTFMSGCLKGD